MTVRALLIDLDGVVYQDATPIPGAAEALAELRARGVPFRFVTNTTSRSRPGIASKLIRFGIPAAPAEVFAPPFAAGEYLRGLGAPSCYACLQADALQELHGLPLTEAQADWVVLGDLGDEWTFARMNAVLRQLMGGARLMALGLTRFWHAADGARLDVGPFAALFQFAVGVEPLVMGKPAAEFFRLAVNSLGWPPGEIAMIGDSIHTDVFGAQQVGLQGVLVRTGIFRPSDLSGCIRPDAVLDSLAEVTNLL